MIRVLATCGIGFGLIDLFYQISLLTKNRRMKIWNKTISFLLFLVTLAVGARYLLEYYVIQSGHPPVGLLDFWRKRMYVLSIYASIGIAFLSFPVLMATEILLMINKRKNHKASGGSLGDTNEGVK
jgi:hypothetical protein